MPGTILSIKVKEGDTVNKGQPLCVLSAMKMEMVVQSPMNGVIKSVIGQKDMKIEAGDLLMVIE